MKVLMGIGNELGGDDAVGLYVAELIDGENGWVGLRWLRQSVGKVFLIGIQAKSFNIAAPLSDEVRKGAKRPVEALTEGFSRRSTAMMSVEAL